MKVDWRGEARPGVYRDRSSLCLVAAHYPSKVHTDAARTCRARTESFFDALANLRPPRLERFPGFMRVPATR